MQHRYADLRLTTMTKPEKLAAFAIGMYAVVHNVLDPPGSTSQFVFRGLLLLALVLVLGTVVVRNRK